MWAFIIFTIVLKVRALEYTEYEESLSQSFLEFSAQKCQELNQNCNGKSDDCCASKLIVCKAFPPRAGSMVKPYRCDNCLYDACKNDKDCCNGRFICVDGKCTHPIGEPCDSNFNVEKPSDENHCFNTFLGCFDGKCKPCGFRACKSDNDCCLGKFYSCDKDYGKCVKNKGCFGLQYACIHNEDCCPTMGCIEGFCKSCVKEKKNCKADSECCPGLTCQGKFCKYAGEQPLPPYQERKCVGKGGNCRLGRKCCAGDCVNDKCESCSGEMDPCGEKFDKCCSGLDCFKNPKDLSTKVCASKRLCLDLGESKCSETPCCEGECIEDKCLVCTHQNELCNSNEDCCPNMNCYKDPNAGFKTKCNTEAYCVELNESCQKGGKACCQGICFQDRCLECKLPLESCKSDRDCCPGNKCFRDIDDKMKTKCSENPFCAEFDEQCNENIRCCEGKCHNGKCTRCKGDSHVCTNEHPCCDPLLCVTNPKNLQEEICAKSKLCEKLGDPCDKISCCEGLCFKGVCSSCTKDRNLCQPGIVPDCCQGLKCVRNPEAPNSNVCATGKLCEDEGGKCSKDMPCCDALCVDKKCQKCVPQTRECKDVPCCDELLCVTNPANIKAKICSATKLCGDEGESCSGTFKCCDQQFNVCHNDVCTQCLGSLKVCGEENPPCCGGLICVTDPTKPSQKVCSDKKLCHDLLEVCTSQELKCCEGLCFKEKCVHCTVNFNKCSPDIPPCCASNICTTDPKNPAEKICSDKKLCSELEEECKTLPCCIGICFKEKCVNCLQETLECSATLPPCCEDLICTTNIKNPVQKVCAGEPMCNDLGTECGHNSLPCCIGMCFRNKCVECGKSETPCSRDDPPCCEGLVCSWEPKTGTSKICFEHETCIEPGGSCLDAPCCNQFKCWRDICRDCWGPGEECHLVENSKGCCNGLHCVLNKDGSKRICHEDPELRVGLDGICTGQGAKCEVGLSCYKGRCSSCKIIGQVCKEQNEACPDLFCTWHPQGSHKEVRATKECIASKGNCGKFEEQNCCSSYVCWDNICQMCGVEKRRCEDGYPPCCSPLVCTWDEQGIHQICSASLKTVSLGGSCDEESKKCSEGTRCFKGKCQKCLFPEEKCGEGLGSCCEPLACKLASNGEHKICTTEENICIFENGLCAGPKAQCCENFFCDEHRICRKRKMAGQECEANQECEPGLFCTINRKGNGKICSAEEGCVGIDGKCTNNLQVCPGLRCWEGFVSECVGCDSCENEKPACDIEEEDSVPTDFLPEESDPEAELKKTLKEKPFEQISMNVTIPESRIIKEPDPNYLPPTFPDPFKTQPEIIKQPNVNLFPEPYELTNMTIPYQEDELQQEDAQNEEIQENIPKEEQISPEIKKPVDIEEIPILQDEKEKIPKLENPLQSQLGTNKKKLPVFDQPLEIPRTSQNSIPEILARQAAQQEENPEKDTKETSPNNKTPLKENPKGNPKAKANPPKVNPPVKKPFVQPVIINGKPVDPSKLRPVDDKEVKRELIKEAGIIPNPNYKTPNEDVEKWGLNYPLSQMKHYQVFGTPWTWEKKFEALKKQKQSPFNAVKKEGGKKLAMRLLKSKLFPPSLSAPHSDIFDLLEAETQKVLNSKKPKFTPRLQNVRNKRINPHVLTPALPYRFTLRSHEEKPKRKCCHGLVCTIDDRGLTTYCSKKKKCVQEFGSCVLKGSECCKGLSCEKGTCLKCQQNNTDCSLQACCSDFVCTFTRDGKKRVCRQSVVLIEEGGVCKDPEAQCDQELKCWDGVCLKCLLKGDQCPSSVPCCHGLVCTIERTGDRKSCNVVPGCVAAEGFCADKDANCCVNHFCNELKVCEPKRPEDEPCDDNEKACMDHLVCTIALNGKGKVCAAKEQCVEEEGTCELGAIYCCSGLHCNDRAICVKTYLEKDEECRFDTKLHTDEKSAPSFFPGDNSLPKIPCHPPLSCVLSENGRKKVCTTEEKCIVESGICTHPESRCCSGLKCDDERVCRDCSSENKVCESSKDCCEGLLCAPDAMGESKICQASTPCILKGGNCGESQATCCSGMECLETALSMKEVEKDLKKAMSIFLVQKKQSQNLPRISETQMKEIQRKLSTSFSDSKSRQRFKVSEEKRVKRCFDCLPKKMVCDVNGMFKCCGEMVCRKNPENEFQSLCLHALDCKAEGAPCDGINAKCCEGNMCFRSSQKCRKILKEFEQCIEGEEELCEEGTQCRVASDGESRLCLSKASCVEQSAPCNLKGAQCCKDSFCFQGKYCKPINHCMENGSSCEIDGSSLACCEPSICALERQGKFHRCMEKEVCIIKSGSCKLPGSVCCPGTFCNKEKRCVCLREGQRCEEDVQCCLGSNCQWNDMGSFKVCSAEKKCVMRGGSCVGKGSTCCDGSICLGQQGNPSKKTCEKSPYCVNEPWKPCHETLKPCCDGLFCGLDIFETNLFCHPIPQPGDQCLSQSYCAFNKDKELECVFNVCVEKKRKCAVLTEPCKYDGDCCQGFACGPWVEGRRCKKVSGYRCEYSDDCMGHCDPISGSCCDSKESSLEDIVKRKLNS